MVKKLIILLIFAALGFGAWYFFFNKTDKDMVLEALTEVAAAASKNSGETTSSMLLKTQMIAGVFADKCALDMDEQMFTGDYTPEDISSKMVTMRQFFNDLTLSFYDAEVSFPASTEAVINFSGSLKGSLKSGNKISEAREIQAKLTKKTGKWQFYSFKVKEIMKK